MNNKQKQVIEKLNSIGFLYDPELVYTHKDYYGCHINIRDGIHHYITIVFNNDNNHNVGIKPYSTYKVKQLTHEEGRIIWNGIINKKNNLKLLIDKI
jgi:hypothetical protein